MTKGTKPLFIRLLVAAIVVYVMGVCYIQNDHEIRISVIEYTLSHGMECDHTNGH